MATDTMTPIADAGLPAGVAREQNQLTTWMNEIALMKLHATSQGIPIPPRLIAKIAELTERSTTFGASDASTKEFAHGLAQLTQLTLDVHGDLAALVAPATPRSLEATLHRPWRQRLVRPSMIAALTTTAGVAITIFIWTAEGAKDQLASEKAQVVASHAIGNPMLLQLNWLSAAVLGAVFWSLFTAYRYVVNHTFDPQYTAVYWIRVILGGVAGVIMANFGKDLGFAKEHTPAVMALVGGYSSEAVNQILMRFTDMLVTAVKGSGETQLREKEKELKSVKAQSRDEISRQQRSITKELDDLAADASKAGLPEPLLARLRISIERAKSAGNAT
jgi:hypothetical protein